MSNEEIRILTFCVRETLQRIVVREKQGTRLSPSMKELARKAFGILKRLDALDVEVD